MFAVIPAVLDAAQLATITSALAGDSVPWVDGRVTAGHQGALVKNNRQLDEASGTARELGDLILGRLERNPLFVSAVLPHRVYPPMVSRYDIGMQFGTHVDGAVRQLPGSAHKLRTDLSATLFLVTPESYEGGELIVESDFGSKSAKLAAGDMVVYTATARHRVTAVTAGSRIVSVLWIQSLIRDDLKRQQLFELDRTIAQLTMSRADAACLVRLTEHYHTLLRLWTEF